MVYSKHLMTTCTIIIIQQERRRIIESQIEADNAAEIAAEQREEEELRIRIQQVIIVSTCALYSILSCTQQWHQRIRQDLANSVPEEPPNGHVGNISVRIRLPTGERVSRIFRSSHTVGVSNNIMLCTCARMHTHTCMLHND